MYLYRYIDIYIYIYHYYCCRGIEEDFVCVPFDVISISDTMKINLL